MAFIREPSVSGTFYPDNPKILKKTIDDYLQNVIFEPSNKEVIGLLSPHAGYIYSGQVAAYGYKAIMGSHYDTVIVIAPSHRSHFEGSATIVKGGYRTPLGVVQIDEELAGEIVSLKTVVWPDIDAHRDEHSLEVQVPFLQVILKNFRLLPLILGSQEPSVFVALADTLYRSIKKTNRKVLVVGSTDLSHYYPYAEAVRLDTVVKQRLQSYDIEGLQDDFYKGTCEACGTGPILTTMMLSKKLGASYAKVLKYANSGDVSGDRSGVVGYISCIFTINNQRETEKLY